MLKRNDKAERYVEFFYRTGTISFKQSKEDDKATKQLLASSIKDVRMLFDNPEDLGRAFSLTVPGSIFHLIAHSAKEAECWVRIFKIVLEMNHQN